MGALEKKGTKQKKSAAVNFGRVFQEKIKQVWGGWLNLQRICEFVGGGGVRMCDRPHNPVFIV